MDKTINRIKKFYTFAGIYGLLVLFPQYFMENKTGIDFPPVITHPEYYYGFIGVACAWQILFLIIAKDPLKYRMMLIPAILEKLSFGGAVIPLYFQGRVPGLVAFFSGLDLMLMIGFIISFKVLSDYEKSN